jgi:serine/threonine-protein kinase
MSSPITPPAAARYRLEDKIAAGGYGEVWRATDVLLGRPVAVKQLPPDRARHPQTVTRFRAEAQRTGSLCHENITRVYDYVEPAPPDPPFLVMELVGGPSVAQVLACGALHPAQAMSVVAETAAGLQAAHKSGFVHRDIKPANLLLTGDGQVKVTDFGVSYAINAMPMTSSNTLLGTPGYVAPERLNGGGVAAAGDLYALGIVAWECLTGHPPFRGTPIEVVVAHRDRPLPPLPASVPAEVAALVTELTTKDPADRPASAGEVAQRAAGLRDRLAREARVSACPLAGPWSGAEGDPSGPHGVSTVPSSEVDLFRRPYNRPPPGQPTQPPSGPAAPPAGPPEGPPTVRHRSRRLRLAVGVGVAALAAVGAATVIVVPLNGGAAPGQQLSGPARQHSPGPSATRPATALRTRPSGSGQTPVAAVSPVISTTAPAATHPAGTAPSTAPAAGGLVTAPSAVASPSATPSTGNGNGKGKAKGKSKSKGKGNGNGKGKG